MLPAVSSSTVLPYTFLMAMSDVLSDEKYVLIATSPINERRMERNMNSSIILILLLASVSFSVSRSSMYPAVIGSINMPLSSSLYFLYASSIAFLFSARFPVVSMRSPAPLAIKGVKFCVSSTLTQHQLPESSIRASNIAKSSRIPPNRLSGFASHII